MVLVHDFLNVLIDDKIKDYGSCKSKFEFNF